MTVTEQLAGLRPGDVHALVREDGVHGSVYTSPQVFGLEMQRIFREGWVFVAHESEVPEPGDYVTKRIAAEPVVVVRGKDGVVRVLANRCTHRGNRLQRGEGEHDVVPLPVPRLDVQQRRRPVQRADARRVR